MRETIIDLIACLILKTYSHAPLNDIWELLEDNSFALDLFNRQGIDSSSVLPQQTPGLCERCRQLDFWTVDFVIKDTLPDLKTRSQICEFCSLLLNTSERLSISDPSNVEFHRVGSGLTINGTGRPVLSICRTQAHGPGLRSPPKHIQIGFPKLPKIESHTYFEVLRRWLKDCDENHAGCFPENSGPGPTRIPTRLIDVGEEKYSRTVRLHETGLRKADRSEELGYIALSHPWGDENYNNHFCTTSKNITDRLETGIPIIELPDTFKHAVKVTRELGVRYLWIDSLCIIQGDDGDFEEEAKHMETVFSSAYCVIAASRAMGTSDGFLKDRLDRKFVRFERSSENPFYICEAIDDFQHDVIEGALNKRGWVLQERALARRTIYFTEKQMYWECGEGVRCETLTRMRNNQAAFLGDPNFPNVATNSTKGGRIRLYESLYKQYSRLQFSRDYDRPIAIAGLEQRLIRAFDTQGGYGVFERYFWRSLLWQRDSDVARMKETDFPSKQQFRVPTWSWMAYEGGITFMDLPFDGVQWEEEEIRSPWTPSRASSSSWHTGNANGRIDLTGMARNLNLTLGDQHIVYDSGVRPTGRTTKCVVIGRQKSEVATDVVRQRHYVLIVAQKPGAENDKIYERVGVGSMPGSWITLDGPVLKVHIF